LANQLLNYTSISQREAIIFARFLYHCAFAAILRFLRQFHPYIVQQRMKNAEDNNDTSANV